MDRNHVFDDLSSYIDNQLSQEEKRKVEEHLKVCYTCAQELSRLKALSEKLKDWQAPDLGPFFEDAVKERILAQGKERGGVKMKKTTVALLVSSGVLVGILVLLVVMPTYLKRGYQERLIDRTDMVMSKKANIPVSDKRYYGEKEKNALGIGFFGDTYHYSATDKKVTERLGYARSGVERSAETPAIGAGEGPVIVIQPVLPATGEGERIIRIATVILEVTEGRDAYRRASEICQEFSGYMASSNFYKDNQGREAGTITMRIPKDKFVACLDKLATLGKVENISSNSQDVSQEYSNLKTQLDTAMIVYNKMLEALQKRQVTISEAMRLESELTPIRQRIENLKNQIEYLDNAISFTTITLNFHEPDVSAKVLRETKRDIEKGVLAAKINAVKFFAKQLPSLVGLVALFFIVLGLVVLVRHLILRLFKRG